MGAPRRNRKKLQRPSNIWNKERIDSEHKIRDDYGLKNLTELWRATSEIRRIRRNVRNVLSGRTSEETGKEIVTRLARYGIVKEGATLDDLLVITPENLLERRLQSIVFRRGMAKSIKQARQLVAHGFISVNGRRAKSPGYLVSRIEEGSISYYKPISLEAKAPAAPPPVEQAGGEAKAPAAEGNAS